MRVLDLLARLGQLVLQIRRAEVPRADAPSEDRELLAIQRFGAPPVITAPGRLPVLPSVSHRHGRLRQHLASSRPVARPPATSPATTTRPPTPATPTSSRGGTVAAIRHATIASPDDQADVGGSALGQDQADSRTRITGDGQQQRRPSRPADPRGRARFSNQTASTSTSGPTRNPASEFASAKVDGSRWSPTAGPANCAAAACPGRSPISDVARIGPGSARTAGGARAARPNLDTARTPRRRRRSPPSRRPAPTTRRGSAAGCGAAGSATPSATHSQARLIAGRRSSACIELIATSTIRATTAASVHDHRNRNRPPISPAAMASPATISRARTQSAPRRRRSSGPARWS